MEEETSAPAPEAPVEAPVVEAPPAPVSRKEVIAETLAKDADTKGDTSVRQRLIEQGLIKPRGAHAAVQPRTEQGKFAPGKPLAKAAPAPVAAPAPAAAPAIPSMPKWLAKELEPHWTQGKPELLNAFLKYGEDANRGIEKYKTEAQSLIGEFAPYEQMLRAENATPQTAIRSLMGTAQLLRQGQPQQKAQAVAQMIRQFQIPFEHVAQSLGVQMQGADGNPVQMPQQDPMLAQLMQRVESMQNQFQLSQQAAQEAENARLLRITETFGKDRPHYEALLPAIVGLINGGLVERGGRTEMEILQEAYDKALRLNPELYEQHLASEREKAAQAERAKANQQAQLSRSAAVQVKGAPGGPTVQKFDPKDRRAVLRAAIAAHT